MAYWSEAGRESHVSITVGDREFHESDLDYWGALCKVRVKLEAEGLRLMCNGTSVDVHPSGMCRDMGGGLVAYRLRYFQESSPDALVNVFEAAPWNRFSTVAAQRERYIRWSKLRQMWPATRG